MLEITVLKTYHASVSEAEKVLPYLKSFDVFSVENAALLLRDARVLERIWGIWHSTPGMNRSKFLQRIDSLFGDANQKDYAYTRTIFEGMVAGRKPLYCSERWETDEQAERVLRLFEDSGQQIRHGNELIYRRREDEGVELVYDGLKKRMEEYRMRDEHVAKNLQQATSIIKGNYPLLRKKKVIRLGIPIGAAHRIERYTTKPIAVIPLDKDTGEASETMSRVYDLMWDDTTIDKVAALIVKIAYLERH